MKKTLICKICRHKFSIKPTVDEIFNHLDTHTDFESTKLKQQNILGLIDEITE